MFTCFIYNVWKFFQQFIEGLTLANFIINLNKYMIENEMIKPKHYPDFISIFPKYNKLVKRFN